MKNILTYAQLFLFGTILFTSCENATISTGDGSEKVKVSGVVTKEKREVKPFRAIRLEGVFNVILDQSTMEEVRVETDEKIMPLVITEMDADTLVVKLKDNVSIDKMKKIDVYITVDDIVKLTMSNVGSLKCSSVIKLMNLDLQCEGVGTTNLNLTAAELNIKSEIVGALVLSGEVHDVTIDHSGIGSINAFDLKTKKMDLTIDGVGGAEVFAANELKIKASGIGNVKYKGGATRKDIKAEGLGKVEEVD